MRVPEAAGLEESWVKLQAHLGEEKRTTVIQMKRRTVPTWAAAAAVLVLVVGVLAFFTSGTTHSGALTASSYETLLLPDGSEVKLMPGASVEYTIEEEGERIVKLEGEAFFKVAKGERFVVETTSGNVEVLGTSFTVFAEDDHFAVECVSGKVAVGSGESNAQLTAGLAVKKRAGSLSEPYAHNAADGNSGDAERSYTNADLIRVFRHIEQHFNVRVRLQDDLTGKEFSGSFELTDAETALRIVTRAMDLELEKVDAQTYTVRASA